MDVSWGRTVDMCTLQRGIIKIVNIKYEFTLRLEDKIDYKAHACSKSTLIVVKEKAWANWGKLKLKRKLAWDNEGKKSKVN